MFVVVAIYNWIQDQIIVTTNYVVIRFVILHNILNFSEKFWTIVIGCIYVY